MNSTFWSESLDSICSSWLPPNHWLFQTANLFLFLSFLATDSINGLVYLRTCLTLGNLIYGLWGWLVKCSPDILLWNVLFAGINSFHVLLLIWKLHPFIRFNHDVEMVYRDLFKPLKVSRHSFKKIYSYTREIQTLKAKDIYAVEGQTLVDKLSLLLYGRVAVIRGGHNLHVIDSHQFLDSPEWFGVGTNQTYQVSIVALEESCLLVWNRDKLKLSISNDQYLQTVLDNILGRDVVKKLLLVTETMSNQHIGSNEQSKLIISAHCAMDQLIRRSPLSNDPINSFWNLSRITESNTETCV